MKQPGMIHNVIVTNEHGTILLSTYFPWNFVNCKVLGRIICVGAGKI